MVDRNFNRDRNRFYDEDINEGYYNRDRGYDRDFDEDFEFGMRNRGYGRGYGGYGREYGRDFEGDWGSRGRGYGSGYGGYGGGYGRGSYGRGGYGDFYSRGYRDYGGGMYGRGTGSYDRDFDTDYGYRQRTGSETSGYGTGTRGDYDRGIYRGGQGGYGQQSSYGRGGYGSQGSYGRSGYGWQSGYGSRGQYGSQYGSFGEQEDYDREDDPYFDSGPGSWTYTETWIIPGPFSGIGPRSYRRSDERIHEDICERMTQHGHLDARNIEIEVNQGEVTLKGQVSNRHSKRMAEDLVESISGVKDVHNQLRVQEEMRQQQSEHNQQQREGQSQQYGQQQRTEQRSSEQR